MSRNETENFCPFAKRNFERSRWAMIALILLLVFNFAGTQILAGGYGGYVVWLGLIAICPTLVCLLSPRFPVACGGIVNMFIGISLFWAQYDWATKHAAEPFSWLARGTPVMIGILLFSICVGVMVGLLIGYSRAYESCPSPIAAGQSQE